MAAIPTHPWRAPANLDATVASLGVEVTDLRRTLIDAGKASTGPHDTLLPPTCFGAEPPSDGALSMENALLDQRRLYKIAHPGRQDTIILVRAGGVTDRTAALSPIVMTYSFALCVATACPGILRHRGLEDPMVRGQAGRGRRKGEPPAPSIVANHAATSPATTGRHSPLFFGFGRPFID